MANIRLRSPYTITKTLGGSFSYATMELQVDSVLRYTITKDALVSGVGQSTAMFEISELVRDYLDITFGDDVVTNGDFSDGSTGWTITNSVSIANGVATFSGNVISELRQPNVLIDGEFYEVTYEVTSYTSGKIGFFQNTNEGFVEYINAPSTVGVHTIRGIAIGTDLIIKNQELNTVLSITNISINTGYVGRTNSSNYVITTATVKSYNNAGGLMNTTSFVNEGFDGYSEFTEGYNFEIPQAGLGQTNTTIYAPELEAGSIPYFDNANLLRYESFNKFETSKTVSGVTVTIKRICEPKFTPIKVTFVNKFGALQDLWFDKKNVESLSVKRDKYKRSLSSSIDGSYSVHRHANKILDVIGNEDITMNTGFVDEGINEVIKELMLSEQCWALIEGKILPMTPTETKKTYKTSLNDKLINHTVKFDYAYDLINNIR